MGSKDLRVGTRVRINTNYLKAYLSPSEYEFHKDYNVTGIVVKQYFVEGIDFYQVVWDDDKTEAGFNRAFLQEIFDPNELLKEIL